jgi:CHAT domain-containing protein
MKGCWQFLIISLLSLILTLTLGHSVYSKTNTSSLVEKAQQQYQQGNFQASLNFLELVNQRFAAENRTLQQAQTQSLISLSQQQLGNWEQAQKAIDYGLALIATKQETISKQQVLGQIWNAKGHLFLRKGQPQKALEAWKQAEHFYRSIQDPLGTQGIILAQTQALENLGFYRRACKNVLEMIATEFQDCQQLNHKKLSSTFKSISQKSNPLQVEALSSLANKLMLLGQLDLAQQAIEQSQILLQKLNFNSSLLRNQINFTRANIAQAKANLARDRENSTQFQQELSKAIAIYDQILQTSQDEQIADLTEARINLLNMYIISQKWDLAQNIAFQDNLTPARLPLNYRTLKTQLALARGLTDLKTNQVSIPQSWDEIGRLYLKISQQAHSIANYRLESFALGYLGQLAYEQQLNLDNSPQTLLERALHLAQTEQAPEIAYRWQWQLGKVYRSRGELGKAKTAYETAFVTLQNLRNDLIALDREIQFSFRQQVEPVYREYTKLLLVEQKPTQIAVADNLKKARNVIEALQLAELDNYFQDACLASQQRNIEDIDPSAAVIYTIILPGDSNNPADRLEVILSLSDGNFYHYETVISNSQLPKTIKTLNNYLLQPDRLKDINQLSHQVYNWLIQPLETTIASSPSKINTLVFVLDGELQNLPMSALYDGQQYLLEKYAIAITPGLRLLNTPSNPTSLTALAAGVSQPRADFSALKNVKTELQNINNTLESQTLLDAQFTSHNFTQTVTFNPFSIVHLATHGQFSSNPEQTFIMLWDRRLTIEDLSNLLQNRQIERSQIIDLLVLSACETAKGDRRATLGLAGMSVRTGVSTTLATLWQISDRSTVALMDRFYHYLSKKPQISKAEALRLAQLALWKSEQQDWQIPLFWAAYVIVGNWL